MLGFIAGACIGIVAGYAIRKIETTPNRDKNGRFAKKN